ncbi:MAG TPA: ATP-binding protein [Candidatus Angelobacter sp.]|nr:ATP-binding protein [Candidatus Angelobacter sp.]
MTTGDNHVLNTNDRFRRFVDSAPLLMCLLDPELKGVYFNQQWVSFTGHNQADLLGDQWLSQIHPQDRQRYLETCRRALESWDKFDVECRLQRFDGEFRYLRHTGTPQFSDEGQLLTYLDTAVDVTARKVAEDALRQTESRCRALFGPSIGNVAVVDCTGRIVGLNDGWMRFARQHGGRLRFVGVGVNYLEVCQRALQSGDNEAAAAHRGLLDVLDGSLPEFSMEYRSPTPSEELWFEMIIHPLQRLEGGAIITHLNITNRRRAEIQAQTLLHELAHVSRVAVLGELTASFAHELSQPFTAIQTNVQAAKHLLAQKGPAAAEMEELLSDILADNLRAGKILQQLRALLKKDRVRLRPVKLNKLIRDVADLLHDEAVLKKVKVSLRLDPALPQVEGERIQLQQIVLNLMVNAFDAMKKNGAHQRELTIETARENGDRVLILVRDTGPGIPESRIDRVFEPFFTTKAEGLGMGLAICRSMVEVHGGKISVANNEGKGVTFRVVLPIPGKGNV